MVINSEITLRKNLRKSGIFSLQYAVVGYNDDMDTKKLLKRTIWLILFILIANLLALKFYWYYSIWYFDMPMHFLGGFFIGLASVYFAVSRGGKGSAFKILSVVFLVGVGWEVFEILVDETVTSHPFNLLDSVSDLFFDMAGGALSLYYCYNLKKNEKFG